MKRHIFSLPAGMPVQVLPVPGDLRVRGWGRADVEARTDGDLLTVAERDGCMVIECDGDLILSLPSAAPLRIVGVGGDADIRGLTADLEIGHVDDDLGLREIGAARVQSVGDDLTVRRADGPITVGDIGGDASLRDVQSLTLTAGDDLYLRGATGDVTATTGGAAVLYLEPRPGTTLTVSAGKDLLLRLPPNADIQLALTAGSEDDLRVDWPGVPAEGGASRTVTLGSGAARAVLTAGGELLVTADEAAWEEMSDFDFEFDLDLSGLPSDLGERINRRVQAATRRAEEAARRAARMQERAQERADRAVERAERRMTARVRTFEWGPRPPAPPSPPPPPSDPVSDEERMTILRMLAAKKITLEEAEKLLAALEG